MKIRIYGDRTRFYQYDLKQKLIIEECDNVIELHITNHQMANAIICECYKQNGMTLCDIPNVLLTSHGTMIIYAFVKEESEYTKKSFAFEIIKRSKPDDYVDEEVIPKWSDLEERIESLEKNGGSGGTTDLSDYAKKEDLENYATKEDLENIEGGNNIDVQINGTSIVNDGVANIPIANEGGIEYGTLGLSKYSLYGGIKVGTNGEVSVREASDINISARHKLVSTSRVGVLTGGNLDYAVKTALTDGKGEAYTYDEQQQAQERLGLCWKLLGDVTVEKDGVTKINIPIDNPNYNEYMFYVYVAERKTPTSSSMYIGFDDITSTSYTLTYVSMGTNTNYYIRGNVLRNCNNGWLTLAMGSKDGKPYSQSHIRAVDYFRQGTSINTEKPTKFSVSLSTGLDIGSQFIVYAR